MRTLLLVALAGCRARTPTYQDVAPIVAAHCAECHRKGGVAAVPPLDDYPNLKQYAQPVRFAVQTRRMPPWGADNTGLCGTWEGARWLTGDEIAAIARWEEAGAPQGGPVTTRVEARASPPFRRDASVETGLYKPGVGPGGNRCFVGDPKLDRDRLLTAIRVLPSDARGVAQVTLFALDSGDAPAPDYPCFGTARAPGARLVASWTWPSPVLRLPAGVRLHARRQLVVQIHYDVALAGGAFQANTVVELEFDDGAREAQVLPLQAVGTLPPGERYVAVENSLAVERRLRVAGIAPRMHIRGKTMHLTVERRGASTCLADFDHWHFNDQQLYRARAPAVLEPGDRVRISCTYNTLGRDRPIGFGDAIDDEECVAYLFVTD